MKTQKVFLCVLAAGALTGCSHDEYTGSSAAGGKLVVTGSVTQVVSRANGVNWDANDAIGVSDNAGKSNIKYVTGGDGAFSSETPIYILGDGERTLTAYYPYTVAVTAEQPVITFDAPADYMWATTTATRENPQASFVFKHKMTQIGITVKDESTGADATGATITLSKVAQGGSFNTVSGAVTASSAKGNVTESFNLGQEVAFVLPPQTFDEPLSVLIEYNGKIFGGDFTLAAAEESTAYHYTINLTKQDPAAELSISSATITDWTNVDNGDIPVGEQEKPKEPNTLEVGDFLMKDGSVLDKNDADAVANKANVAGVVYYVGNPQPSALYSYTEEQDILKNTYASCTNGLAIALNNAQADPARFASRKFNFKTGWYEVEANAAEAAKYIVSNLNVTSASDRILGFNNTAVIKAATAQLGGGSEEGQTGCEAVVTLLDGYQSANAVAGASSWYVPSYAELAAIQANYSAISASLAKVGGQMPAFADFATEATQHFYWSSDLRGDSNNWVSPLTAVADGVNLYRGRNSSNTQGYFRFAVAF